jgi:single-strand DNA-binding protein
MNLAVITITGNLTKDGESRYTPSGAMSYTFTVAVNGRKRPDGTEPANFFRTTCWGKLAEVMANIGLTKGQQVICIGSFEAREYQDQNGVTRTSLDVNADHIQLVGKRDQAAPTDSAVPF